MVNKKRAVHQPFFNYRYVLLLVLFGTENEVNDDTENECTSDGSDRHFAECDRKAADAADKDGGYDEEISVVFEVNFLYHLKTGNGDEAVKRDANAAHYA